MTSDSAASDSLAWHAPVSPEHFSFLAIVLTLCGLFGAASFIIYELSVKRGQKNILHEMLIAGVASTFLGFGTLFVLLSAGLYV